MRTKTWIPISVLTIAVSWQLGGCNLASLVPPIPPVVIDLAGSGLGTFEVEAGVPTTKAIGGVGAADSQGFDLKGSIQIDLDAISVNPSGTGGSKTAVAQQVGESCSEACDAAGVDAAVCQDVCDNGNLQITVWAASPDNSATVCDGGADTDTYGPYIVELDDQFVVLSIDPTFQGLQQRTQDWLDTVGITFCVQVIAPVSGEVLIDSLKINLSL